MLQSENRVVDVSRDVKKIEDPERKSRLKLGVQQRYAKHPAREKQKAVPKRNSFFLKLQKEPRI